MRPPLPPFLLLAALLHPISVSAQVEAEPVLRGRVLDGTAASSGAEAVADDSIRDGEAPGLAGMQVVVHRVAPDSSGEVGTVESAADGSFSFELPSVPGSRGALYFASVEHHGVLYFGEAVAQPVQLDSLYRIVVHDTVAAPSGGLPPPVAVRYLILEQVEAPDGPSTWRVTDLFRIQNGGDRTIVPPEVGPVWSHPLPPSASAVEVGAGEVSADAAGVEEGRLVVRAPLPPGERQLVLRYTLPSPEMTIPLPLPTRSMELLVREPAPPLEVEGLEAIGPVQMEPGTTYRRYAGSELVGTTVTVRRGAEEEERLTGRILAVVLGLLLVGAGIWGVVRRAPATSRVSGEGAVGADADERRRIVLEIARIDERLAGGELAEEERVELRRQRGRLADALATREAGDAPASEGGVAESDAAEG